MLNKDEQLYLERIFESISLMTEFDKGRLLGIAEEMVRKNAAEKAVKEHIDQTLSDKSIRKNDDHHGG